MGNDENWIRSLREAGREYRTTPVAGLWEELEGELFVARRPLLTPWMCYVAASLIVAVVASLYIICGSRNQEDVPVLTILAGGVSVGEDVATLIDEEAGAFVAQNERLGNQGEVASTSESAEPSAARPEIEGYGEFSFYESIIVVEDGPDLMNNDCVLVSAGPDVKASLNSNPAKANHSNGIGGRLYASVSGAKLSGGTPMTVGATVDIPIADGLRLETGLEYTGVRAGGSAKSYVGVPVKVSYDIYDRERMRVYACAGGEVVKSLDRRDVSMALNAGAGLEYSFDDDWGIFVEPGVEYRPGDGGCTPAVYGDRYVGPEVRVGFRHTFR